MPHETLASRIPDVSQDAVVVVPGIMGSALLDTTTGREVWGLKDPRWYLDAWLPGGRGLSALHLTSRERDGLTADHPERHFNRIKATGLLTFPAFAPLLAGLEPYTALLASLRDASGRGPVADAAAVLEFPYDWRLPVRYNARLLAIAAADHLRRWRAHSAHDAARRTRGDDRSAGLVLVAHSMGGLLARALALDSVRAGTGLAAEDIRTTITLGTPFYGSVKAALILATGRDAPIRLPAAKLRALAATLPGVHDLLPTYRCVEDGDTARRLTAADVAGFGGDRDLFTLSADHQQELATVRPLRHRSLVGIGQPTLSSLRLTDGEAHACDAELDFVAGTLVRRVVGGDGTVYRGSAALVDRPEYRAQQHGALASDKDVVSRVGAIIREPDTGPGPLLGAGELGMSAPDLVPAGSEWTVTLTGIDRAADATCQLHALTGRSTRLLEVPRVQRMDGQFRCRVRTSRPGLYRLVVAGGGGAPLTQLVLVGDLDGRG